MIRIHKVSPSPSTLVWRGGGQRGRYLPLLLRCSNSSRSNSSLTPGAFMRRLTKHTQDDHPSPSISAFCSAVAKDREWSCSPGVQMKERCPSLALLQGVGGWICQGTISEGGNFAPCRNPEACCGFLVGSGWCLVYFLVGTFRILGNTAFQCIPVTQPPHVANKRSSAPSLRLVHRCTCLSSQCSPASEFAVKLLVTYGENFARGTGKIRSRFRRGKLRSRNFPLPCTAEGSGRSAPTAIAHAPFHRVHPAYQAPRGDTPIAGCRKLTPWDSSASAVSSKASVA